MPDLLLIDGKHLLWRNADANSDLAAEVDGQMVQTGAIYGFLNSLARLYDMLGKGSKVVVCWDDWMVGPAGRRKLWADYKRKEPPDRDKRLFILSMESQMMLLMEMLSDFSIFQAFAPEWEADDVIGTLAHKFGDTAISHMEPPSARTPKVRGIARPDPLDVAIVSGDRDLLQLVAEHVTLYRPKPNGEFTIETPETVEAEWGVKPYLFADLKALMGDKNEVPGIDGVGPVAAAKILQHHPCAWQSDPLNPIYQRTLRSERGEVPPLSPGIVAKVTGKADIILLSKWLAKIKLDVAMKWLPRTGEADKAMALCLKLKFKSLFNRGKIQSLIEMGSGA